MKKITTFLFLFVVCLSTQLIAQNNLTKSSNEADLNMMLTRFMDCIVKKDSVTFYGLFHDAPIPWIGVTKEKTKEAIEKKVDKAIPDFQRDTYKNFFKFVSQKDIQCEEKFYNIKIVDDGYIATITFDYSFWENSKKINWGIETWNLVKVAGKWKITSVIYSFELESIAPEPKRN